MRSTLKITMLALAGLTAIKIGTIGVEAAGDDVTPEKVLAETSQPEETTPPETPVDPVLASVGATGPVLPELLVDLAAERDALAERGNRLLTREAELKLVEETLTRQHRELAVLRDDLEQLLENVQAGHGADVDRLVNIYQSMKPAQAGAIIGDMDLEVATLVIATMNERSSGPILAQMDTARAQIISKIIYERSKMPGDQTPVMVPRGG